MSAAPGRLLSSAATGRLLMSAAPGRLLSSAAPGRALSVMLASLRRGTCVAQAARTAGVTSVRCLALSAQDKSREDKVSDEPIKFSTSKASHRTWRVERSLGSQFERPWWKVLPLSLFFGGLILWCALREQTHIDELLQKQLYEHLPGLLPETEDEQPDSPAETEQPDSPAETEQPDSPAETEQPDPPAEDEAQAK